METDEKWLFFHRVWHKALERWVIVEKCDGKTRARLEPASPSLPPPLGRTR